MADYSFCVEVAEEYGVDGAIFIHALAFWIRKNNANGRHFHDGRTWTYNTQNALVKLFPFWTKRQIGRITSQLKEQGAILTGCYSEDKTDRTIWYALSDRLMDIYGISVPMLPNGNMHVTIPSFASDQTVTCNCRGTVNYIPPIVPPEGDGAPDEKDKRKGGRKGEAKTTPPEVLGALLRYAGEDEDLSRALMGFAENRQKLKKPMATEYTAEILLRSLDKLSGGDRAVKIALLEKATLKNWLTVYELKPDELPSPRPEPGSKQEDEWNVE